MGRCPGVQQCYVHLQLLVHSACAFETWRVSSWYLPVRTCVHLPKNVLKTHIIVIVFASTGGNPKYQVIAQIAPA